MAVSTETRVGAFFLAGLILMGIMLEMGEKWNPFEKQIRYKTYLSAVTGLKVGDPVRLAGVTVGKIVQITVRDKDVELLFEVAPATRVKKDAIASLRLMNLLGGQFLSISFGSPGAPLLEPEGTLQGKDSANIDIIVDNVSDLTKDAKVLITSLTKNQDDVLKKIAGILDDNRTNLRDSINNLRSISEKIDRGDGSLALLLNTRALYDDASLAAASLRSIAAKIDTGQGTFGRLVNDDSLYVETKNTVLNLKDGVKEMTAGFTDIKEIAAKINSGEGTLGKLVNEDALYTDLAESSSNIKEITRKLNDGQGTLGKLINEDKLYRDTTATMKKAEKAMDSLGDSGPIQVLGSIIGTLF